jgi:two-component system chemotaxis response regulator CheY
MDELRPTAKDRRVLIVDDNDLMRQAVRVVLKGMGFAEIMEAQDGIEALAKLKQSSFGLLIADWNMPAMDGITLVRMVRADPGMMGMIVIMLTAEREKARVAEAIKAGISDYIVKPFSGDVLRKKLEEVLARHLTKD